MLLCFYGVFAVLELVSHPDHTKGPPDPCTLRALRPIPFIDPNHTTLHELCLEVLTVHGNELRLFGPKAFLENMYKRDHMDLSTFQLFLKV